MSDSHTLPCSASTNGMEIAIIGMSCRFPGARNLEQYWQNLRDGVESIAFFTDDELIAAGVAPEILKDPHYVKARPLLDDVDLFDAQFFGLSPREARILDPQQRFFLECAWEALEQAGCDPDTTQKTIGVYGGVGQNNYLRLNLLASRKNGDNFQDYELGIANEKDFLATRVAYKLNLRGPSVTIQTACSTSLVAVHQACQSLLSYQCDIALAGGVSILLPHKQGYLWQSGWISSADGHCRAFDASAGGTIFGSGAGIVVMKRLGEAISAGDTIHAVIKGSAINNDGSLKIGYTAPSVTGQSDVIAMAQALAGVAPDTISYVEAHGTGTQLGDPIEIEALNQVFRQSTDRRRFCAIGSVKTNIGHVDVAAGVAGLIKTVLALKHKQLPPSLHFEKPNPRIDLASSPFYVNTKLSDWQSDGMPRRAGVSSFGVGGTNAHVVLEEAPGEVPSSESRPWQLLLLSARTETALDVATANLAQHLREHPNLNLADAAHTLQVGRKVFAWRRMAVCRDPKDAACVLATADAKRLLSGKEERSDRSVAFMFSGQGSQYPGMARELYETEATFRGHVDACCRLLERHLGLDLRAVIYPRGSSVERGRSTTAGSEAIGDRSLDHTWLAQPALFVIEYALAQLWIEWGVKPQAMIGHSIGEYAAACLANVISLEDALALVAVRGRLMQELPGGAMLSVGLPEDQLRSFLPPRLSIAAVNTPSLCVVSGPAENVGELEQRLKDQGTSCQRLRTSHAFHSALMEPILERFTEMVRKIKLHPPSIPFVSNVTGTWITEAEAADPAYWARHLRQAVRYSEGIRELMKQQNLVLLEIGPGQTLTSLVRRNMESVGERAALSSLCPRRSDNSDAEFMLKTLGRLWLLGVPVNWKGFYLHERRRRIPLPTYPFERQRYWIEPEKPPFESNTQPSLSGKRRHITDCFYLPSWKQAAPLAGASESDSRGCSLAFVDAGGFGDRIAQRLLEQNQQVVTVAPGNRFVKENDQRYAIRPGNREDYEALFAELDRLGLFPDRVIHSWTLNGRHRDGSAFDRVAQSQELGFLSLIYLAQTIGKQKYGRPLRLAIVASGLFDVTGEETLRPENATILGPCQTIPQEYPNIDCRLIDLAESQIENPAANVLTDVIAEISADSLTPLVAYRGRHRWIRSFESLTTTAPVSGKSPTKEGGVYLITGGLGGIGLELAAYLAQGVRAKLVLLGRSRFPDRGDWEQWLATHGEGDPVSQRISKVKSLEAAGAEVLVISADVADIEQMKGAIEQAKKRFGAIYGVIHAAGVAGGGVIQLKDVRTVADVLSAKVRGTLVLDELLKDTRLDFFVLCSSVLALTGRVGQVDYCAANAFLDAYAHSKRLRDDSFTISINWDGWKEVGMAASSARNRAGLTHRESGGRKVDHPLLDRLIFDTPDRVVYHTKISVAKHWVLDEHRISGTAALPGTAFLEMARAAFGEYFERERIAIHDVFFLTPLIVREDESRDVFSVLERVGEAYDFRIISRDASNHAEKPVWREHARGKVGDLTQPIPDARLTTDALESLKGAPGRDRKGPTDARGEMVQWGPRWNCVKTLMSRGNEVLARLELHDQFNADLAQLHLHPALLDVATSLGVRASGDNYLPLAYRRVEVHGPLSGTILVKVKVNENFASNAEILTFDALIMDPSGKLLVRVEAFSLKRVNDQSTWRNSGQNGTRDPRRDHARLGEAEARIYESLGFDRQLQREFDGILPHEGVAAFQRILSLGKVPQIIVSVTNLASASERPRSAPIASLELELPTQPSSVPSRNPRNLQSEFATPKNDPTSILASIWQEVLGIERVGVNDNFFELGGDSVIAIQVIAKANKAGFRLAINDIFQHQTVTELAVAAEASRGQEAAEHLEKQTFSPANEFGWTPEEKDRIARALIGSSN